MNIEQIARELLHAEQTKQPIRPLTETYEGLTADEAYSIQLAQINIKKQHGASVKGYKIGLTSKVMQEMLGIHTPDYGFILDTMMYDERTPIDPANYIQPKVEFELAFFLKKTLTGEVTLEDVMDAIDYVVPSIELIDSRIEDWRIRFEDTIADNGSSAGAILGAKQTKLEEIEDITNVRVKAYKNGELFDEATSAAVLGNPLQAVVWLANAVREYRIIIEAGSFVMSGAVSKAVPFSEGDQFEVDFGPLGSVHANFAKSAVLK